MLGDSFVHMHDRWDASFEHQLFRFLGSKIDSIAPDSGGERVARDKLHRRQEELATKRIVVWLASEQIFRSGENWTPRTIFD